MNCGFHSGDGESSLPVGDMAHGRLRGLALAAWPQRQARIGLGMLLLLVFALALAPAARAAKPSDWSVRVWAPPELAGDFLLGVAVGADGFLWTATATRLVAFDGAAFTPFPARTFGSDKVPRIRLLLGARDGTLWVALGDGRIVHIMQGRRETFAAGLSKAWPEALIDDGEGALWVSYRFGLLARIKDGRVTTFGKEVTDTGARITLAVDEAGALWMAQGGEISVFRDGRFQSMTKLADVSTRLARASGGGLWIYSGKALLRFHEESGAVRVVHDTGKGGTALFEDRTGAVWIGTLADGLLRYESGAIERVPTSSREVTDIREDGEGSIWVSTRGGGLNQVRRRALTLEGTVTSLPHHAVQALCEGAGGEIWATMSDGAFVRRVGDNWTVVHRPDEKFGGATVLAGDPAGGVWIGTRASRLHHWSPDQLTTLGLQDGLACHTVKALCMARDGTLWIGGGGPNTLQAFSEGKFRRIRLPRLLLGVSALAEDAAGTLWVGTTEGPLLRVVGDIAIEEPAFTPEPGGRMFRIRALHAFADGSLWVAYYGGGLARIKDGRYVSLRAAQGIRSDFITALVPDDRGFVWCAAPGRVLKFRRSELDALADGRIARIQPVEYGPDQGWPALVPNPTAGGAAVRTGDGRLWIPMGNVLVIANPAVGQADLPPVRPLVTGLEIDEERRGEYRGFLTQPTGTVADLSRGERLHFALPRQKVAFTFAATSFAAPGNVAFRYRLAGFDEAWLESAGGRAAVYPRLSPGDYRFEVMACNSAGQWSDTVAAVRFTIDRPFWQTPWFFAGLLAVFTLGVVWLVRRVSLRRMRRNLRVAEEQAALGRERARIARDIHDDVGNRLTQILLWSGLAQRDVSHPARTIEHLERISGSAEEITDALDEIVWAVNPRNDTLSHLIDYLGTFAVEFLRSAGIRCALSFPSAPAGVPLSAEVRHHVFLVTKEALANIVRHAGATEVRFDVTLAAGHVSLTLADNGRGFAAAPDDATADGLRNMRSRMAEIGGTCDITSVPGAGTRVACTFACPGLLHPVPPASRATVALPEGADT